MSEPHFGLYGRRDAYAQRQEPDDQMDAGQSYHGTSYEPHLPVMPSVGLGLRCDTRLLGVVLMGAGITCDVLYVGGVSGEVRYVGGGGLPVKFVMWGVDTRYVELVNTVLG